MALPTALLVKGLAGVGAIAGVVGGGFLIKELLKPKDPNEIIKDLGIEDTTCHFTETNTIVTCTLDANNLKKVKFEKTGGTFDSASASLTITKVTGEEAKDYTKNLKFTIKNTNTATNNNDLTLGSSDNTITLKKDVDYDFKIKTVGSESKLEKAWDLTSLAKKVGLTCQEADNSTTCTLPTTGINVWKAEEDYITNASVTANSSMSVAKDTKDYNQGFKFTVTSNITLTPGTQKKANGGISQLTQSNKAYEIALKDDNGTKKWFLVEKDTTSG